MGKSIEVTDTGPWTRTVSPKVFVKKGPLEGSPRSVGHGPRDGSRVVLVHAYLRPRTYTFPVSTGDPTDKDQWRMGWTLESLVCTGPPKREILRSEDVMGWRGRGMGGP